jgi:hypothetical protein
MANHKEAIKPYGGTIMTGTSDSILASLFRTILIDLGITPMRFNVLLEKYIDKSNIPKNIKEVSSLRGNLKKELLKSTMSWKGFIKGLIFINIKRFEVRITLHHGSGKITEHYKSIVLDKEDINDD